MVPVSLAAANTLQDLGINAEVVDLRTLVPLDRERIVDSVKKTGRAVIVEEGWKTGGVGAEIMSVVVEGAFDYLDAPIMRIAAKDRPIPFSPQMEKYILPSKGDIVKAVQKVVE
jgi:pyruvate dehydrogenase E1 component beta subunit